MEGAGNQQQYALAASRGAGQLAGRVARALGISCERPRGRGFELERRRGASLRLSLERAASRDPFEEGGPDRHRSRAELTVALRFFSVRSPKLPEMSGTVRRPPR